MLKTSVRCLFLLIQLGCFLPAHAGDRLNFYWNLFTVACDSADSMHPEKYGISTNEPQTLMGDKIVTLYESKLGLMPLINENGTMINGGIPQRMNMTAHLDKVENDVNIHVPNINFAGPIVIDYESYTPSFDFNVRAQLMYNNESIMYARQHHPGVDEKTILKIAKEEYNRAAKTFFLKTIKKVRVMRPLAKVGYYIFPKCNYDAGAFGELECNAFQRQANRELAWLYEASSALFPTMYFYYNESLTSEDRSRYAYAQANEAIQIREALGLDVPIIPFTEINYCSAPNHEFFYSNADVNVSIGITDLNIQGLVIWDTSNHQKERCPSIKMFLENIYGPQILHQIRVIEGLSKQLCGGHGRAVAKWTRPPTPDKVDKKYRCVCDDGFYGKNCQHGNNFANEYIKLVFD